MKYVAMILSLAAMFLLCFTRYNKLLHFSGVIWGIQVPCSPKQKAFMNRNRILFIISLIAVIALFVPSILALFSLLFKKFLLAVVYIAAWVGCAFLGSFLASKRAMHSPLIEEESNAAVLGNLPFVKSVEAQMDQATSFIVSFEGIALINHMNYCYALERYENYQMGSLTTPDEVAMIGLYFVQKYHDKFDFKVDTEVIPGEPGQTVTFVGTAGINTAHISGTPDQRIFRSYIFTRK